LHKTGKQSVKLLDEKASPFFGSTTNGEFIDEETESGAVAILLLDMKKEHFRSILRDFRTTTIGKHQNPLP
jgi:hypothetical protein